jgi:hypothetical protein
VGVEEVSWDKGDTARVGDYPFLYEKGNENYHLSTGFFFCTHENSVRKRVELVTGYYI